MIAFLGLLACASMATAFSAVTTTDTNVLRYRVLTSLTDGGTVRPFLNGTVVTVDDQQLILHYQIGSGPLTSLGPASSLASTYRTLNVGDFVTGNAASLVTFYLIHSSAVASSSVAQCNVQVLQSELARYTVSVVESSSPTTLFSCSSNTNLTSTCQSTQTIVGAKTFTCGATADFPDSPPTQACPTTIPVTLRRQDTLCAPLRVRTGVGATQSTYLNTLFRTTGDVTLARDGDYELVAPVGLNEQVLSAFPGLENAFDYEVTVTGTDSVVTASDNAFYVGYVKILNAAHREISTISGMTTTIESGTVSVAIETSTGVLVEFIQALAAGVATPSTADQFLALPGTENGAVIVYTARFFDGRVTRANVYGNQTVSVTNPITQASQLSSTTFSVVGAGPGFAPLYQLVVIQNNSPTGSLVLSTVITLDTSAVDAGTTEHIINNQITGASVKLVSSQTNSCEVVTPTAIGTGSQTVYEVPSPAPASQVQIVDGAATCNSANSNLFPSLSLDANPGATTCQRTYYFLLGRTYSLNTTSVNSLPNGCTAVGTPFTGSCTTIREVVGDLSFVGTTRTSLANPPTIVEVVVPLCDCIAPPAVCTLTNACDVNALLGAIADSNLLTSSIATIVSSINGNVDAVKNKVDSTKDAVDKTIDAVYLVRNNLNKFGNDVEDDIDEINDNVDDLQDDVEDVDKKLKNVRDDVTHIRADAKAIRANQD